MNKKKREKMIKIMATVISVVMILGIVMPLIIRY